MIFAGPVFTQTAPRYSGLPADVFLTRWLVLAHVCGFSRPKRAKNR
jgi:hypothetical protein